MAELNFKVVPEFMQDVIRGEHNLESDKLAFSLTPMADTIGSTPYPVKSKLVEDGAKIELWLDPVTISTTAAPFRYIALHNTKNKKLIGYADRGTILKDVVTLTISFKQAIWTYKGD